MKSFFGLKEKAGGAVRVLSEATAMCSVLGRPTAYSMADFVLSIQHLQAFA